MKRAGIAVAIVMLAAGLAGQAWAVPPGFTLEFDGNGEGKVTFTGAKHTGPGMHCSNCHMDDLLREPQFADHSRRPQAPAVLLRLPRRQAGVRGAQQL